MHNELAREQMIEHQVRAWAVLDARVLAVFRSIPREHFTPASHRHLAFVDTDVPLLHGQHMLKPSVEGRLLQALDLKGTEKILQIGVGSGYITACLAAMSAHVRALEIHPDIATLAASNLASLAIRNAEVVTADATREIGNDRYDAIVITASLPVYDERYEKQLAIGGRLFVVVGELPIMDARTVKRVSETGFEMDSLFETVIDPLQNARRAEPFHF